MAKLISKAKKKKIKDAEQDALKSGKRVSGEPDSNLSAVAAGGIAGATAGAVIGTVVAGPIGTAVAAGAGAILGGAGAEKIADIIDPKLEEAYWEENYKNRPYYKLGEPYESYLPAYRYGWESSIRKKYENRTFEEIEADLEAEWHAHRGASNRQWSDAKQAIRDAFERIRERVAGALV